MYGTPQFARPRGGTYCLGAPLSTRRSRRFGRLGALTPDQAAQQAMPTSSISSKAGFTQAVYNDIVAAAAAGNFTAFNPSGCAGIKPSGAKLAVIAGAATAGTMLLKFGGASANPILIGVGAGLEVGSLIFSAIFSHHSQAVAKEQQVVCAAVPAASDSISAIDGAVQDGTLTPQQGIAALQQLLSSFQGQVASIVKNSPSQCNAACVWTKMLTAIVAMKSSQYQDLANQQAATVASVPASLQPVASALLPIASTVQSAAASAQAAVQSAGLPSWLLPAAGFFLLWEIL
jgi:hypothetical protein